MPGGIEALMEEINRSVSVVQLYDDENHSQMCSLQNHDI